MKYKFVLLFLILSFFALLIYMVRPEQRPINPAAQTRSAPRAPLTGDELLRAYQQKKEDDLTRLAIRKERWQMAGFGTIAVASFEVVSKLPYPIKDLVITCKFLGNSRTTVSILSKTLYENIDSLGTLKVRDLSFGFVDAQAARATCGVTDFEHVLESSRLYPRL